MSISKYDKVIDSRDVMSRIEELREEREDYTIETLDGETECDTEASRAAWAAEYPDDAEELAELEGLAEEAEGYGDWAHGETLIHENHWVDYARELAEETGAIDQDASWPHTCIDWTAAADELAHDYMTVDFGGETFYMRA